MKGLMIKPDFIGIGEDTDLLGYRLDRLVSIAVGEVPGIPGAGSKIKELFYNPMDVQTCLDAVDEINTLCRLYEPNIFVSSISCYVQVINSDSEGVILEINGELINNKKSFTTKIIKIRDNN